MTPQDFGAVADGINDDGPAIQAAADYCMANNKALQIPEGKYLIDTDVTQVTFRELHVSGSKCFDVATGDAAGHDPDRGAVIYVVGSTNSPFNVERGATVEGISTYYPNQKRAGDPDVYPPTWNLRAASDGKNITVGSIRIIQCHSYNSYQWLKIENKKSDGAVGNIYIGNCMVYGIHNCLEIGYHRDVVRVESCSFEHSAMLSHELHNYTLMNGTCLLHHGGADGFYWHNNLITGYDRGWVFDGPIKSAFVAASDSSFEARSRCIYLGGEGPFTVAAFSNCKMHSMLAASPDHNGICVDLQAQGELTNKVVFNGCHFRESNRHHIRIAGRNEITAVFSGCVFYTPSVMIDSTNVSSIKVLNSQARVLISGCDFHDFFSGRSYGVLANAADTVQVFGSRFENFKRAMLFSKEGTKTATVTGNISSNSSMNPSCFLSEKSVTESFDASGNIFK